MNTIYFVYLLECGDKSIYTGITTDVARRFNEHKAGVGGNYTRSRHTVRILYTERYATRSEALKRESEIKGWNRQQKLDLITTNKEATRGERATERGAKNKYT